MAAPTPLSSFSSSQMSLPSGKPNSMYVFYFFNNPLSPVNATCMHVSAVAIMVGPPGASTLKKTDSLSAAANSFSLRGWSLVSPAFVLARNVDWLDLEQNLHQVLCRCHSCCELMSLVVSPTSGRHICSRPGSHNLPASLL